MRSYAMLFPILALSGAASIEKLSELLPSFAQDPEGWLGRAREGLSETVGELYAYWADARRSAAQKLAQRATPVQKSAAKVGRNDPCPCGSGKKSKKCCAN